MTKLSILHFYLFIFETKTVSLLTLFFFLTPEHNCLLCQKKYLPSQHFAYFHNAKHKLTMSPMSSASLPCTWTQMEAVCFCLANLSSHECMQTVLKIGFDLECKTTWRMSHKWWRWIGAEFGWTQQRSPLAVWWQEKLWLWQTEKVLLLLIYVWVCH